jgi:hypothetical protein
VLHEREVHSAPFNECGHPKDHGNGSCGQYCDWSVVGAPPTKLFSNLEMVFLPNERFLIVLFFIVTLFLSFEFKERNRHKRIEGEKHGFPFG